VEYPTCLSGSFGWNMLDDILIEVASRSMHRSG
jgi:hypothetical protein